MKCYTFPLKMMKELGHKEYNRMCHMGTAPAKNKKYNKVCHMGTAPVKNKMCLVGTAPNTDNKEVGAGRLSVQRQASHSPRAQGLSTGQYKSRGPKWIGTTPRGQHF